MKRVNTLQDASRQRAEELLKTEMDFISNPFFQSPEAEHEILRETFSDELLEANDLMNVRSTQSLPSHLARLCKAGVLSAGEEYNLFRRMNYLKYRANSLRSQLDPDAPVEAAINTIDSYLHEAQNIRNYLLRCNMRLVVSIVKKCATPHVSFDELLSDGIWTLMRAVDKFDYSRGFRFSTYAYHAISNYIWRKIANRKKVNTRFIPATHSSTLEEAGEVRKPGMDEQIWQQLSGLVANVMNHLDRREQLIVQGRFALGEQQKVRTFQSLADELGISKERVRQLEQRAVAKLRLQAAETDLEMMCELVGY